MHDGVQANPIRAATHVSFRAGLTELNQLPHHLCASLRHSSNASSEESTYDLSSCTRATEHQHHHIQLPEPCARPEGQTPYPTPDGERSNAPGDTDEDAWSRPHSGKSLSMAIMNHRGLAAFRVLLHHHVRTLNSLLRASKADTLMAFFFLQGLITWSPCCDLDNTTHALTCAACAAPGSPSCRSSPHPPHASVCTCAGPRLQGTSNRVTRSKMFPSPITPSWNFSPYQPRVPYLTCVRLRTFWEVTSLKHVTAGFRPRHPRSEVV